MDYFNGTTNQDFIDFFLKDLNCIKVIPQIEYPNFAYDDTSAIEEHISKCQYILTNYIINVVSQNDDISTQIINELTISKRYEILTICENDIEACYQSMKIKTIKV